MPDIFGREAHQYSHIRALQEAGLWEQQVAARAAEMPGLPPHDFHALGRGLGQGNISRFEGDAQAIGYITNNLQAIHSMQEEILYTGFRLNEFLPIVTGIPEGAKTYAYRVVDHAGLGAFIENDGTSAPAANAAQRLVPYALRYAGIIPEWTIEDLRNAMMTGLALDTETIMAGMTGAINHIEQVAFTGIADEGVKGLTNLPTSGAGGVTRNAQGASETFDDLTAEEIRALIVSEIGALIEDSNQIFGRQLRAGMCIYLPQSQFNKLTSEPFGDNSDKSIWDFIQMYNPWTEMTGETPMLKALLELKNAGTAANTDRMVVAINDTRVWEMAIPIYPRILTTINYGYSVKAPMEYKISGLNVKRPKAIRYRDAI